MATTYTVRVEPVTNAGDPGRCFEAAAAAFGAQTADPIWIAMNPGWDTPEGKVANTSRFGVVLDPGYGEVICGMAMWHQGSTNPENGVVPDDDLLKALGLESLYPGNAVEHRYLSQVMGSLFRQRGEVISQTASRNPPAIFALDLCAVDPKYQRKGIASKLVQWGLDEAKRRGGLEAVTEASKAGRFVYGQLGFKQGPEIEYRVDEEFRDRPRPSNVFMRTGTP